ncbi:hypothetical protein GHH61_23615 [Salmonella enterica]|nr:hypothetical protein [Salmonella enterica]
MNAQVKNDFNSRLIAAVDGYKKSSKDFVTLVIESATQFWDNSDNAQKATDLVNAVGAFGKLQSRIKTLIVEFCPVASVEDDKGVLKFSNSESWANLRKSIKDEKDATKKATLQKKLDEKKANYLASLEKFKDADLNSVFKDYKENQDKFFTPYTKVDKATSKATSTGAELIARLMLSFSDMSLEDAKLKITSAINGLTSSEIESAKKAVLSKTPLKVEPEQQPQPEATTSEGEAPKNQAA